MAVAWPSQLQQYLNEDNFGYEMGSTVIASQMDTGPRKLRRRFTTPIDVISCSIDLPRDDFSFFKNFYNITLNGGVTPFTFTHPILLTSMNARFVAEEKVKVKSLGGGYFRVDMSWEVLA